MKLAMELRPPVTVLTGTQLRLYRLSPPHVHYEELGEGIVASAVHYALVSTLETSVGRFTVMFASDRKGNITDGAVFKGMSEGLTGLGYTVLDRDAL